MPTIFKLINWANVEMEIDRKVTITEAVKISLKYELL